VCDEARYSHTLDSRVFNYSQNNYVHLFLTIIELAVTKVNLHNLLIQPSHRGPDSSLETPLVINYINNHNRGNQS
jgi:hypothetical protein